MVVKGWVIVAILAGLGIWFYMGMRETYGPYGSAYRSSCMSNLRQVAKAALLYSEANDGRLMLSKNWMDVLTPAGSVRKEILHCPCIPGKQGYGYAFNSELSGTKVSSFELPEHTPLAYESKDWSRNASDPVKSFSGPYDPGVEGSARANIVYLTGHVERPVKDEN